MQTRPWSQAHPALPIYLMSAPLCYAFKIRALRFVYVSSSVFITFPRFEPSVFITFPARCFICFQRLQLCQSHKMETEQNTSQRFQGQLCIYFYTYIYISIFIYGGPRFVNISEPLPNADGGSLSQRAHAGRMAGAWRTP